MNVQGDEPDIDINDIKLLDNKMKSNNSRIGTLAAKISDYKMYENENVVKVKIENLSTKIHFQWQKILWKSK